MTLLRLHHGIHRACGGGWWELVLSLALWTERVPRVSCCGFQTDEMFIFTAILYLSQHGVDCIGGEVCPPLPAAGCCMPSPLLYYLIYYLTALSLPSALTMRDSTRPQIPSDPVRLTCLDRPPPPPPPELHRIATTQTGIADAMAPGDTVGRVELGLRVQPSVGRLLLFSSGAENMRTPPPRSEPPPDSKPSLSKHHPQTSNLHASAHTPSNVFLSPVRFLHP